MGITSASSVKNIVRLLDNGFMVYIHIPTGKVTAIPEFDDFVDFNDSNNQETEDIEMHPDDYLQVKGMNSREMFNTMMDFAQEQEDREVTKKLVCALRKNNPIQQFSTVIKLMPCCKKDWLNYRDEKLQQFIKLKLLRKKQMFN